ncbi:uncharacterized protein LOC141858214 [Brevipalpus obovatus]|uniref:uncharacterized protein LOC141858214 n=1 Tax=Brevipalpus obovatus TaxID=246614 RepID=UPI003D9DD780
MNEFTVPHVRSSRNSIDFDRCVRTWSYYAPLLTKEGTNLISSAVKIARVEVSQETGYPKYRYIARELLKSLEEGILERILFYCVEILRVYSIDLGISINDLDVSGLSETLSHWSPSEAYQLKSNERDPSVWFRLVDVRSITTQTSDLIRRVHRKVQTDRSFLMPSYRPPKILDELSRKKKIYGQILSEYPVEWIDEELSRDDTTPDSPESVIYNSAWGSSRATQTMSDRDLNSDDVEYEYYFDNQLDHRFLEDIEEMEELSLSAQEDYEDLLIANQALETGLMALVAGEMAILASEIAISDEQCPLKPCVVYEKQNELPFLEDDGWENDHQRYLYRRRTSSLTRPKSTTSSPFTFSPPDFDDDESKEIFNYPSRSDLQPSRLSVHSTTSSCCSESKASQTDESEFEEEVVADETLESESKLSSKPPIERKIKKLIISQSPLTHKSSHESKSDHESGSFPSDETLEMQTFPPLEDYHVDKRSELSAHKTSVSLKVSSISSQYTPEHDGNLIPIPRVAELESSSTQVYHTDIETPIEDELYPPSDENPETMDIYWSDETSHAMDDYYIGAVVSDAYSSYHPTRDHQLREVSAERFTAGISDKSGFSHDNLGDDDDHQFEVDFSQPIHPDDYLNHIQESIRDLQNHPAFDSPPSDPSSDESEYISFPSNDQTTSGSTVYHSCEGDNTSSSRDHRRESSVSVNTLDSLETITSRPRSPDSPREQSSDPNVDSSDIEFKISELYDTQPMSTIPTVIAIPSLYSIAESPASSSPLTPESLLVSRAYRTSFEDYEAEVGLLTPEAEKPRDARAELEPRLQTMRERIAHLLSYSSSRESDEPPTVIHATKEEDSDTNSLSASVSISELDNSADDDMSHSDTREQLLHSEDEHCDVSEKAKTVPQGTEVKALYLETDLDTFETTINDNVIAEEERKISSQDAVPIDAHLSLSSTCTVINPEEEIEEQKIDPLESERRDEGELAQSLIITESSQNLPEILTETSSHYVKAATIDEPKIESQSVDTQIEATSSKQKNIHDDPFESNILLDPQVSNIMEDRLNVKLEIGKSISGRDIPIILASPSSLHESDHEYDSDSIIDDDYLYPHRMHYHHGRSMVYSDDSDVEDFGPIVIEKLRQEFGSNSSSSRSSEKSASLGRDSEDVEEAISSASHEMKMESTVTVKDVPSPSMMMTLEDEAGQKNEHIHSNTDDDKVPSLRKNDICDIVVSEEQAGKSYVLKEFYQPSSEQNVFSYHDDGKKVSQQTPHSSSLYVSELDSDSIKRGVSSDEISDQIYQSLSPELFSSKDQPTSSSIVAESQVCPIKPPIESYSLISISMAEEVLTDAFRDENETENETVPVVVEGVQSEVEQEKINPGELCQSDQFMSSVDQPSTSQQIAKMSEKSENIEILSQTSSHPTPQAVTTESTTHPSIVDNNNIDRFQLDEVEIIPKIFTKLQEDQKTATEEPRAFTPQEIDKKSKISQKVERVTESDAKESNISSNTIDPDISIHQRSSDPSDVDVVVVDVDVVKEEVDIDLPATIHKSEENEKLDIKEKQLESQKLESSIVNEPVHVRFVDKSETELLLPMDIESPLVESENFLLSNVQFPEQSRHRHNLSHQLSESSQSIELQPSQSAPTVSLTSVSSLSGLISSIADYSLSDDDETEAEISTDLFRDDISESILSTPPIDALEHDESLFSHDKATRSVIKSLSSMHDQSVQKFETSTDNETLSSPSIVEQGISQESAELQSSTQAIADFLKGLDTGSDPIMFRPYNFGRLETLEEQSEPSESCESDSDSVTTLAVDSRPAKRFLEMDRKVVSTTTATTSGASNLNYSDETQIDFKQLQELYSSQPLASTSSSDESESDDNINRKSEPKKRRDSDSVGPLHSSSDSEYVSCPTADSDSESTIYYSFSSDSDRKAKKSLKSESVSFESDINLSDNGTLTPPDSEVEEIARDVIESTSYSMHSSVEESSDQASSINPPAISVGTRGEECDLADSLKQFQPTINSNGEAHRLSQSTDSSIEPSSTASSTDVCQELRPMIESKTIVSISSVESVKEKDGEDVYPTGSHDPSSGVSPSLEPDSLSIDQIDSVDENNNVSPNDSVDIHHSSSKSFDESHEKFESLDSSIHDEMDDIAIFPHQYEDMAERATHETHETFETFESSVIDAEDNTKSEERKNLPEISRIEPETLLATEVLGMEKSSSIDETCIAKSELPEKPIETDAFEIPSEMIPTSDEPEIRLEHSVPPMIDETRSGEILSIGEKIETSAPQTKVENVLQEISEKSLEDEFSLAMSADKTTSKSSELDPQSKQIQELSTSHPDSDRKDSEEQIGAKESISDGKHIGVGEDRFQESIPEISSSPLIENETEKLDAAQKQPIELSEPKMSKPLLIPSIAAQEDEYTIFEMHDELLDGSVLPTGGIADEKISSGQNSPSKVVKQEAEVFLATFEAKEIGKEQESHFSLTEEQDRAEKPGENQSEVNKQTDMMEQMKESDGIEQLINKEEAKLLEEAFEIGDRSVTKTAEADQEYTVFEMHEDFLHEDMIECMVSAKEEIASGQNSPSKIMKQEPKVFEGPSSEVEEREIGEQRESQHSSESDQNQVYPVEAIESEFPGEASVLIEEKSVSIGSCKIIESGEKLSSSCIAQQDKDYTIFEMHDDFLDDPVIPPGESACEKVSSGQNSPSKVDKKVVNILRAPSESESEASESSHEQFVGEDQSEPIQETGQVSKVKLSEDLPEKISLRTEPEIVKQEIEKLLPNPSLAQEESEYTTFEMHDELLEDRSLESTESAIERISSGPNSPSKVTKQTAQVVRVPSESESEVSEVSVTTTEVSCPEVIKQQIESAVEKLVEVSFEATTSAEPEEGSIQPSAIVQSSEIAVHELSHQPESETAQEIEKTVDLLPETKTETINSKEEIIPEKVVKPINISDPRPTEVTSNQSKINEKSVYSAKEEKEFTVFEMHDELLDSGVPMSNQKADEKIASGQNSPSKILKKEPIVLFAQAQLKSDPEKDSIQFPSEIPIDQESGLIRQEDEEASVMKKSEKVEEKIEPDVEQRLDVDSEERKATLDHEKSEVEHLSVSEATLLENMSEISQVSKTEISSHLSPIQEAKEDTFYLIFEQVDDLIEHMPENWHAEISTELSTLIPEPCFTMQPEILFAREISPTIGDTTQEARMPSVSSKTILVISEDDDKKVQEIGKSEPVKIGGKEGSPKNLDQPQIPTEKQKSDLSKKSISGEDESSHEETGDACSPKNADLLTRESIQTSKKSSENREKDVEPEEKSSLILSVNESNEQDLSIRSTDRKSAAEPRDELTDDVKKSEKPLELAENLTDLVEDASAKSIEKLPEKISSTIDDRGDGEIKILEIEEELRIIAAGEDNQELISLSESSEPLSPKKSHSPESKIEREVMLEKESSSKVDTSLIETREKGSDQQEKEGGIECLKEVSEFSKKKSIFDGSSELGNKLFTNTAQVDQEYTVFEMHDELLDDEVLKSVDSADEKISSGQNSPSKIIIHTPKVFEAPSEKEKEIESEKAFQRDHILDQVAETSRSQVSADVSVLRKEQTSSNEPSKPDSSENRFSSPCIAQQDKDYTIFEMHDDFLDDPVIPPGESACEKVSSGQNSPSKVDKKVVNILRAPSESETETSESSHEQFVGEDQSKPIEESEQVSKVELSEDLPEKLSSRTEPEIVKPEIKKSLPNPSLAQEESEYTTFEMHDELLEDKSLESAESAVERVSSGPNSPSKVTKQIAQVARAPSESESEASESSHEKLIVEEQLKSIEETEQVGLSEDLPEELSSENIPEIEKSLPNPSVAQEESEYTMFEMHDELIGDGLMKSAESALERISSGPNSPSKVTKQSAQVARAPSESESEVSEVSEVSVTTTEVPSPELIKQQIESAVEKLVQERLKISTNIRSDDEPETSLDEITQSKLPEFFASQQFVTTPAKLAHEDLKYTTLEMDDELSTDKTSPISAPAIEEISSGINSPSNAVIQETSVESASQMMDDEHEVMDQSVRDEMVESENNQTNKIDKISGTLPPLKSAHEEKEYQNFEMNDDFIGEAPPSFQTCDGKISSGQNSPSGVQIRETQVFQIPPKTKETELDSESHVILGEKMEEEDEELIPASEKSFQKSSEQEPFADEFQIERTPLIDVQSEPLSTSSDDSIEICGAEGIHLTRVQAVHDLTKISNLDTISELEVGDFDDLKPPEFLIRSDTEVRMESVPDSKAKSEIVHQPSEDFGLLQEFESYQKPCKTEKEDLPDLKDSVEKLRIADLSAVETESEKATLLQKPSISSQTAVIVSESSVPKSKIIEEKTVAHEAFSVTNLQSDTLSSEEKFPKSESPEELHDQGTETIKRKQDAIEPDSSLSKEVSKQPLKLSEEIGIFGDISQNEAQFLEESSEIRAEKPSEEFEKSKITEPRELKRGEPIELQSVPYDTHDKEDVSDEKAKVLKEKSGTLEKMKLIAKMEKKIEQLHADQETLYSVYEQTADISCQQKIEPITVRKSSEPELRSFKDVSVICFEQLMAPVKEESAESETVEPKIETLTTESIESKQNTELKREAHKPQAVIDKPSNQETFETVSEKQQEEDKSSVEKTDTSNIEESFPTHEPKRSLSDQTEPTSQLSKSEEKSAELMKKLKNAQAAEEFTSIEQTSLKSIDKSQRSVGSVKVQENNLEKPQEFKIMTIETHVGKKVDTESDGTGSSSSSSEDVIPKVADAAFEKDFESESENLEKEEESVTLKISRKKVDDLEPSELSDDNHTDTLFSLKKPSKKSAKPPIKTDVSLHVEVPSTQESLKPGTTLEVSKEIIINTDTIESQSTPPKKSMKSKGIDETSSPSEHLTKSDKSIIEKSEEKGKPFSDLKSSELGEVKLGKMENDEKKTHGEDLKKPLKDSHDAEKVINKDEEDTLGNLQGDLSSSKKLDPQIKVLDDQEEIAGIGSESIAKVVNKNFERTHRVDEKGSSGKKDKIRHEPEDLISDDLKSQPGHQTPESILLPNFSIIPSGNEILYILEEEAKEEPEKIPCKRRSTQSGKEKTKASDKVPSAVETVPSFTILPADNMIDFVKTEEFIGSNDDDKKIPCFSVEPSPNEIQFEVTSEDDSCSVRSDETSSLSRRSSRSLSSRESSVSGTSSSPSSSKPICADFIPQQPSFEFELIPELSPTEAEKDSTDKPIEVKNVPKKKKKTSISSETSLKVSIPDSKSTGKRSSIEVEGKVVVESEINEKMDKENLDQQKPTSVSEESKLMPEKDASSHHIDVESETASREYQSSEVMKDRKRRIRPKVNDESEPSSSRLRTRTRAASRFDGEGESRKSEEDKDENSEPSHESAPSLDDDKTEENLSRFDKQQEPAILKKGESPSIETSKIEQSIISKVSDRVLDSSSESETSKKKKTKKTSSSSKRSEEDAGEETEPCPVSIEFSILPSENEINYIRDQSAVDERREASYERKVSDDKKAKQSDYLSSTYVCPSFEIIAQLNSFDFIKVEKIESVNKVHQIPNVSTLPSENTFHFIMITQDERSSTAQNESQKSSGKHVADESIVPSHEFIAQENTIQEFKMSKKKLIAKSEEEEIEDEPCEHENNVDVKLKLKKSKSKSSLEAKTSLKIEMAQEKVPDSTSSTVDVSESVLIGAESETNKSDINASAIDKVGDDEKSKKSNQQDLNSVMKSSSEAKSESPVKKSSDTDKDDDSDAGSSGDNGEQGKSGKTRKSLKKKPVLDLNNQEKNAQSNEQDILSKSFDADNEDQSFESKRVKLETDNEDSARENRHSLGSIDRTTSEHIRNVVEDSESELNSGFDNPTDSFCHDDGYSSDQVEDGSSASERGASHLPPTRRVRSREASSDDKYQPRSRRARIQEVVQARRSRSRSQGREDVHSYQHTSKYLPENIVSRLPPVSQRRSRSRSDLSEKYQLKSQPLVQDTGMRSSRWSSTYGGSDQYSRNRSDSPSIHYSHYSSDRELGKPPQSDYVHSRSLSRNRRSPSSHRYRSRFDLFHHEDDGKYSYSERRKLYSSGADISELPTISIPERLRRSSESLNELFKRSPNRRSSEEFYARSPSKSVADYRKIPSYYNLSHHIIQRSGPRHRWSDRDHSPELSDLSLPKYQRKRTSSEESNEIRDYSEVFQELRQKIDNLRSKVRRRFIHRPLQDSKSLSCPNLVQSTSSLIDCHKYYPPYSYDTNSKYYRYLYSDSSASNYHSSLSLAYGSVTLKDSFSTDYGVNKYSPLRSSSLGHKYSHSSDQLSGYASHLIAKYSSPTRIRTRSNSREPDRYAYTSSSMRNLQTPTYEPSSKYFRRTPSMLRSHSTEYHSSTFCKGSNHCNLCEFFTKSSHIMDRYLYLPNGTDRYGSLLGSDFEKRREQSTPPSFSPGTSSYSSWDSLYRRNSRRYHSISNLYYGSVDFNHRPWKCYERPTTMRSHSVESNFSSLPEKIHDSKSLSGSYLSVHSGISNSYKNHDISRNYHDTGLSHMYRSKSTETTNTNYSWRSSDRLHDLPPLSMRRSVQSTSYPSRVGSYLSTKFSKSSSSIDSLPPLNSPSKLNRRFYPDLTKSWVT